MNELYNLALADNGREILFIQNSLINGRGLFTSECLPADTILSRRLGVRTSLSPRDKRAIVGIDGVDPAIPEDFIFKSINHSCHPNAYLTDTGCLISLGNISEQEEITIDYNPLLLGSEWRMKCNCGLPNCRGFISSL